MGTSATSELPTAVPNAAASAITASSVDARSADPAGEAVKPEALEPSIAAAEISRVAQAVEAIKREIPEAPSVAAAEIPHVSPAIEAVKQEVPRAAAAQISIFAPEFQSRKHAAATPERPKRFALLAAAIALAASFGALAGALGTSELGRPAAASADASTPQDIRALHSTIEQMRSELTALRSGVESGTRNTNAQFGKITERFDRVERTQTERAAKFAKATEAIERLERRADPATAKETTGSIKEPPAAHPTAAASAPAHQAAVAPTPPPQPASLPGWSVRDVYRGVAVISSARTGLMEVEAGDIVPFLGRIESIRRHDGRWIVVTSRGPIISGR
jgi:hypothetical protein